MLIGAALALPLNGYACGPDFPNRLLIDRNGTLLYMPEGNFAFEAGRLVPADKQLPRWQAPPPPMPPKPMPQSPETVAIGKMRAAKTVEEADAVNTQVVQRRAPLSTGCRRFRRPRSARHRVFPAGAEAAGRRTGRLGLRAQYSLGRVLMNDHGTPMNESGEAAPAPSIRLKPNLNRRWRRSSR